MKSLLFTIEENCIGCNKCIFYCPVEDANVSFINEKGENKIRVNDSKCIMCGKCLDVCDHHARDFRDDTEHFFADLEEGAVISIIAAPAVKTNFTDYKRLFGYLHATGVKHFYDVSFGADITTWAYLRTLQKENLRTFISQPCPAVVNYMQKYCHDILEDLITVQSPMLCTAIYLKKYLGVEERLCFLSPCIAKIWEINEPETGGFVTYSITFKKLADYLQQKGIDLHGYTEKEFDLAAHSLGEIFSLPGGLRENVHLYAENAWVKQVEGTEMAYPYLGEYSRRKKEGKSLPLVVDILSCSHGCNIGSGTTKILDVTDVEETMNMLKVNRKKSQQGKDSGEILAFFDNKLSLKDFRRQYAPEETPPFLEVPSGELEKIFNSMHKFTEESRNRNCNACGYASCQHMAAAIYNNCNHKENCLDYNIKLSAERDILEQKNREITGLLGEVQEKSEQLEEAFKQLKELDQLKTDFLSTVSHELRTPLTSVLGFARMIEKKIDGTILPRITIDDKKVNRAMEQVRGNVSIIVSEGERLTKLINDVLDIAKMEAGRTEWKMDWIHLPDVISQSIASISSLYESKGIDLLTEMNDNLPTVFCDSDRIIQVLLNLFSNAVKFTAEGPVICRVMSDGEFMRVSVVDRGMGIAPEDCARVFEKFRQAGDVLTDKPKGTGLGLPICKEIVEHHGGAIWVESELGLGSTFSFTLPLQPLEKDGDAPEGGGLEKAEEKDLTLPYYNETPREPAIFGRENLSPAISIKKVILVVDDEKQIRLLLRQLLQEKGYRVDEAGDGLEAIKKIKQTQPDLVILDVKMPQLCGFDVAAVIKNDPQVKKTPIVFLSMLENRERGLELGVENYFTKPADIDQLLQVVDELLEKRC
jgi:signal transduction histidine kinase/CheY-like chemotaxis protein/ferredoxin